MARILVSACLFGCECRYKGDSCKNDRILALGEEHVLIPVCPEQLGGLPTPREPAEIQQDGSLKAVGGRDVTAEYQKGARTALEIATELKVDFAILKANSPSCGTGMIYDGSFTGGKKPGNGVTSALFQQAGIPVYTEEELDRLPL